MMFQIVKKILFRKVENVRIPLGYRRRKEISCIRGHPLQMKTFDLRKQTVFSNWNGCAEYPNCPY